MTTGSLTVTEDRPSSVLERSVDIDVPQAVGRATIHASAPTGMRKRFDELSDACA